MKFATSLTLAALSMIGWTKETAIEGGARMHLDSFKSKSSFLDAIHDTSFTLKKPNNGYLFVDTASFLMDTPSPQEKYLKTKVEQLEKRQQLKKQSMYGGKKHRLGTDDQVRM